MLTKTFDLRTIAASDWVMSSLGTANAALTLTQPAPGLGRRHYVDTIELTVLGASPTEDILISLQDAQGNILWREAFGSGTVAGVRTGVNKRRPIPVPFGSSVSLVVPAAGDGVVVLANLQGHSQRT